MLGSDTKPAKFLNVDLLRGPCRSTNLLKRVPAVMTDGHGSLVSWVTGSMVRTSLSLSRTHSKALATFSGVFSGNRVRLPAVWYTFDSGTSRSM